ncbi:hypothetical protein V6N11_011931 [Hibiscus sabdariffa]|uniref:Uncharacterized protein n=1 Tax=Hibiscus sabdariffa TaxID=183260 RepID=A0ABR2SAH2_9ROSI
MIIPTNCYVLPATSSCFHFSRIKEKHHRVQCKPSPCDVHHRSIQNIKHMWFSSDDWLNLYLDNYRLHCMGTKGSWTPLHADVFRSYIWSANVYGKKKWPQQVNLLIDRHGQLLAGVCLEILAF